MPQLRFTFQMESKERESILLRIICNPGLSHIADKIFLFLNAKTLIECTEVCLIWKWYIIENRLLRKNILGNRAIAPCFSSAPEKSYNRLLLKRLLGVNLKSTQDTNIDTEEEFQAFKTFVNRANPDETEKRLSSNPLPNVKVPMAL